MTSKSRPRWGKWIRTQVRHVAEGGQARVYLVKDSSSNDDTIHILKELKNPKRIKRFQREVALLKLLPPHTNVLHLLDDGISAVNDHKPFYVMPRADTSLDAFVTTQPFDIILALQLFEQICAGVTHLHTYNIIHRDLKPDNILIFSGVAKVADFGLALENVDERLTATSEIVGPRFYMAPELEDGRLDSVGPEVDVYSLGKILYYLLSGGKTFAREKHHSPRYGLENCGIDERASLFSTLLDRTVVSSPSQRLSNAMELHRAFTKLMDTFQQHPKTTILGSFVSIEAAITASRTQLRQLTSLPSGALAYLLERASAYQEPLLQAALANPEDREVIRASCNHLLRFHHQASVDVARTLAARVTVANSGELLGLSLADEIRLVELAVSSEGDEIANAIANSRRLSIKHSPITIAYLFSKWPVLTTAVRRNLLITTYDISFPNKRDLYLEALLAVGEDVLALEAIVAGLCSEGDDESINVVVDLFEQHVRTNEGELDEMGGAVIRGVCLPKTSNHFKDLSRAEFKNEQTGRLMKKLVELNLDDAAANSARPEES